MLTVIETPIFQSMVATVWNEAEAEEFVSFISENAQSGEVIPHTGGLRKVRWSRAGMGKRGGARVIFFTRIVSGEVVLIAVYAKAKFDNLPAAVLKSWKEAFDG
jgi:hypothetical protein